MNIALLKKSFRDTWFLLALAFLGIAVFEVLLIQAFHYTVRDAKAYFQHIPEFAARFITVIAGTDIRRHLTPTGLMSIGFAHPVVHVMLWAFAITFTTRVLVGEIDRGTADLLLSLPISRTRIYFTLTVLWLLAGAALAAAPLAGTYFAQEQFRRGPFEMDRLALVALNLFGLYVAVGAASLMVSAMSSRRGPAIGLVVALLVASFALNFLSAIWDPAKKVAFLGVLEYYKPLVIIDTGRWPARDLAVLGSMGLITWLTGWVVFARRDIRTG